MRYIFHRGSRKVDDVNSIPRPGDKPRRRDGGKESNPACIAVLFEVLCPARKAPDGRGLFFDSYLGRLLSKRGEKTAIPVLSESLRGTIQYPPIRTALVRPNHCPFHEHVVCRSCSRPFEDYCPSLNTWGSALTHRLDLTEEDPFYPRRPRSPGSGLPSCRQAKPASAMPTAFNLPSAGRGIRGEAGEAFESLVHPPRERNSRNNIDGKTSVVAASPSDSSPRERM